MAKAPPPPPPPPRSKIHGIPRYRAVAFAIAEIKKSTPSQTSAVSDKPAPAEADWVVTVKEKLKQARADADAGGGGGAWAKLSIYRIPQCLRNSDESAYVPQTVSLGPYHHGQPRLLGMERHKWRAVHRVLERADHGIERYLAAMKKIEAHARACYEGPVGLGSNDFVEMLVLDSTFALELFRGADRGFESLGYSPSDPVFAMRAAMYSIQRDMIMLENQIPLFVLDRIHYIQSQGDSDSASVARLALRFFKPLVPTDEAPPSGVAALDYLKKQDGLHCLEVFRRSLLVVHEEPEAKPKPTPSLEEIKKLFHGSGRSRPHTKRVGEKNQQPMIHCVTELKEAGVKFKIRKTDRFCDIDFSRGVLKIPRLLVHDGTKSLFLNLIAFEQCHLDKLDCTNGITSYAIFMDSLIDSPADVTYLHYCGIVENCLGSDVEVADLFNGLCHEVVFHINDSTISVSEKVNRYYNHRWNAWRASLTHNYFNNPWSIISFIAAIVLVLLTLAQTFYAVYAYYVPPS